MTEEQTQNKKDALYETVQAFINSVDIIDLNEQLVKVLLNGIKSGETSPNDTANIHALHVLMQDLKKIIDN